ncbi:MAG: hypothetical protein IBX68_10775 [Dehalococcoidia bacterium]|nr:hypothetical protein [Dehalococcoidia bacterium]
MDMEGLDALTDPEYLNAKLQDIFFHNIELLVGTAQAYRTDESPVAGKKLAGLIQTLEETTQEAGTDRLVVILPLLVEVVADSLVELMAENNRRLIEAFSRG